MLAMKGITKAVAVGAIERLRLSSFCQLRRSYKRPRKTIEHCLQLEGEILYGIQPVKLCLLAERRTVHCVYYNPGSGRAAELAQLGGGRGVRCVELSRPGLDSLCRQADRYKEHHVHQGIVADVSPLRYEPLAPAPAPAPGAVWVVLCSVRDPGNLGAIVRTCHYLGVARLVVAGARCQLSTVVSKTSSGTLELETVYSARSPAALLRRLAAGGCRVLAADIPDYHDPRHGVEEEEDTEEQLHVENDLDNENVKYISVDDLEISATDKTILVLGSEGAGIPPDLLACAPERVMVTPGLSAHPALDSLNVSVAAGIIIHKLCHNARNKDR